MNGTFGGGFASLLVMLRFIVLTTLILVGAGAMAASCDDDGRDGEQTPGTRIVVDAPIDELELIIRESFPPQYAARIVSGLPSGCAQFDEAEVTGRSGNEITIRVTNTMPDDPNVACTAIYGTKETIVELGSDFTSGERYTVRVNDKSLEFTAQ
jgi:hypothetical protein